MSNFQDDFYLETKSPLRIAKRNAKLLGYILNLIWAWAVDGARIRRAVRRARKRGQTFFIDEWMS